MKTDNKKHPHEDRLFHRLKKDLSAVNHIDELHREFRAFRDFYLDPETQNRLRKMGILKRWIYFTGWILKSMFFKLSPIRRLMVAAGIAQNINAVTLQIGPSPFSDNGFWGAVLIVFVLLLELKDKSIAREELEAGRQIQAALMPERNPDFTGWSLWLYTRPANEVGGDMVDFLRLTDSLAGAAITDVAGKGLRAALLTAKLQATLRALFSDSAGLSELCGQVNRIFCRDGIPSIFASMTIVRLSSDSGVIQYVNAGHLPALHVSGKDITEMEKGDPALGLSSGCRYNEKQIALSAGDVFFIYSDGVTEACNRNGEFFGTERLKNFIARTCSFSAVNIGESLIDEIDRFTDGAESYDDLSVIVIKKM